MRLSTTLISYLYCSEPSYFVDFGVVVPSSWDPKQIVDTAILAEENGLDFFLITDHYLSRHSVRTNDSWTVLAAVAVKTRSIRIGTCVTPIPFRPPQILAKVVSTVDQLSEGRSILGVGAGWYKREFVAYSKWEEDIARVAKTIEGVRLITKLWTSTNPFDFHGKFFVVEKAILEPKPIQKPYVPLWFGSTGSHMLKIAAKYAEAWVPSVLGHTGKEYESVISRLREFEAALGRETKVKVFFNGTIEEISRSIDVQMAIGCEGAILARTYHEEITSAVKKLGREIMPSYKRPYRRSANIRPSVSHD